MERILNRIGSGLVVAAALLLASCQQMESFYNNVHRSDVFFQAYDDHRYDFLFVFDNSTSMKPRRDFVRDNMRTFVTILNSRKAIDYQMAMVTTDYLTDFGNLVNVGGMEVVKSSDADPVAGFSTLVNSITDTPRAFWEQGLISARDAIFEHGTTFMRDGVPLVVIFLTDEEDWSCKEECWGIQPEDNDHWVPYTMDFFIPFFQNLKSAENVETLVFPIVGTSVDNCDIASLGTRYMELATAMGGASFSSSICDSDIRDSFEAVASKIADRGVRFKLTSESTGKGISVWVNHQLVPNTPENYLYEEESNSILFTGAVPKNGDIVEVTYSQQTS